MKKLFVELGLFFIAPIEKLSHAIQWLTGKDNFAQARCMTYVTQFLHYLASLICAFILLKLGTPALFIIVIIVGMMTYILAWLFGPCYRIEITNAEKRLQPGFRNSLQMCPGDSFIRIFWSILSPVLLIHNGIYAAAISCHTICTYLRACTPLPPCSGKIKEWWNKIKSPKGEPIPEGAGA